ncbi:MAG: PHP domain-containing protein [Candidatus Pacearchaeota archaeon]|nr:PHP domain-containing protein [Candidatus Pacearchaeota archaeon]
MKKIDLHIHSTASDGKLSPKEIVDLAIKNNLSAIAITDHDTPQGSKEAREYSKNKNIEIVEGIEITVTPPENCKELHIVGLFIDSKDHKLNSIKKNNEKIVEKAIREILDKLNKLGYKIKFEELVTGGEKNLNRPFIANILLKKYPNDFLDRKDIFNKLLGKNGKAFVIPKATELDLAIKMVHDAKGIAILAHPWFLGDEMKSVIKKFADFGGDGIEKYHSIKDNISNEKDLELKKMIKKYNLSISGGTDFHEVIEHKPQIGDIGISKKEFKKLKEFNKKC